MEEPLHVEKVMIEQILHQMMIAIKETTGCTLKEKQEMREKAYIDFLERAKSLKGAPAFKTMSIEELKNLYQQVKDNIDKVNGR